MQLLDLHLGMKPSIRESSALLCHVSHEGRCRRQVHEFYSHIGGNVKEMNRVYLGILSIYTQSHEIKS